MVCEQMKRYALKKWYDLQIESDPQGQLFACEGIRAQNFSPNF